jgi:peptide/nickel transport system substrate-binding protein
MLRALTLAGVLCLGTIGAVEAQTPQRGGTLNFVAPYGSSFSTLDVHATPTIQDDIFASSIHRSLYRWDSSKNEPVLELATDVSVSADGTVFTYKLRQNAVFHHGKKFTADDVIWSYHRVANPSNAFPGARYVANIKGVAEYAAGTARTISGLRKIDDHTLEITFNTPTNPGFALMRGTVAIYPSDIGGQPDFATRPSGLGAFRFVEHVPGSRAVVERFDRYYKEGLPYLDRINLVIMGDASARDVAFRNREIDVSILGPAQYQAYQADPELRKHIIEVAEVFTRNIGFNHSYQPFTDRRVRQAINHAINSKLIIQRLARNKAYPATGWLPLSSPAYDEAAVGYDYDPAKARALLAEAGYANGFEFEVNATSNESWGVPIVEAIIPMLAQVGIKVRPRPVESAVHSEFIIKGEFQAYIWSNATGPDPLSALQCFYSRTPRSACNYTGFSNPEFDRLFEAARAERDPAKQNDLLRQANNLLQQEAPVWFFNYNKAVMAYQPWLHGLEKNATELALQNYEALWIDNTAPASRR